MGSILTPLIVQQRKDPSDDRVVVKGELFCGGFSGWSQAMTFIQANVIDTNSVLAVDNDPQAAKTFAINYGGGEVIRNPKEAAYMRKVQLNADSSHQTFQCDVRSGWWCQFVPKLDIRLLLGVDAIWFGGHSATVFSVGFVFGGTCLGGGTHWRNGGDHFG